jgi:hypothetical protein
LYNASSVPSFTIKAASSGPINIIDHGDHYSLYNNQEQWMSYQKNSDSEIKAQYSSYDLAFGDVLVSGLGFGILPLWLCDNSNVNSVTVIEISKDVIKLFKESNVVPNKLTIINDNMITYNTNKKYNAILLDHYEKQDFDFILKDIENICNRIDHDIFWAWSLEAIYLFKMYSSLDNPRKMDIDKMLKDNKMDLSKFWAKFIDQFFPKDTLIKNISNDKLNSYICNFFDKPH